MFVAVNIFQAGEDGKVHHLLSWCHYLIVANNLLMVINSLSNFAFYGGDIVIGKTL